ncbi:MAG: Lrp/AsnC family transcriptional regulator [Gammaproteobacteria bacterium]|nr:MAG: Lrp/AsnC family transcriptional regulator [Gammaproteobacteria bacterium]
MNNPASIPSLTELERTLVNRLQHGIDITPRPFDTLAESLNCTVRDVIESLNSLKEKGILMRFGPLFNAVHLGGEVSLVAMAVPEARFDEVGEVVNSYPEVAHNYAREHTLNMWFVVSSAKPGRIEAVLADIEARTGLRPLNMPKEEEYYVGLYFEV